MELKTEITQNSHNLADDMVKAGPLLRVTNTFAYVAGIKDGLSNNPPAWPEHPLYWDYHLGHKLGLHMRSNPAFDFTKPE